MTAAPALHRSLVADAIKRPALRPYQQDIRDDIESRWLGVSNVLAVLPTGAGKTVLFSSILADEPGASCAIAHRQELVSQISLALARNGVRHRIIGQDPVIRMIVRLHMEEVGANYVVPNAKCAVASVNTLTGKKFSESLKPWLPTVKLWVQDEAHHVLRDNQWGRAAAMFPNARGLGVTATPLRADGNGLGRHADGLFDTMVTGPSMRDLITMGHLTDYKLYAPKSNFKRDSIKVSDRTGDFTDASVTKAVATSNLVTPEPGQIVGNVVETYLKLLKGKLTIVFAPDVKLAYELESQYIAAGVPAKCVHGGDDDNTRNSAIRAFRRGEIKVLVNVALFDEGFDLPAIEAVQDVSATESFGRFVQRVGRALRLLEGKKFGLYVDHVGNIARHSTVVNYSDGSTKIEVCHREWSLDRRERRSSGKSDAQTIRACLNPECGAVYERFRDACPYCGTPVPPPAERSRPEFVDGDLFELDPAMLEQMRGAVARVDMMPEAYRAELTRKNVPQLGIMANVNRHIERQETIGTLREAMAVWAGYERAAGLSDREIFRKFYIEHGHDWMTAQTLKRDEALGLAERVMGSIKR